MTTETSWRGAGCCSARKNIKRETTSGAWKEDSQQTFSLWLMVASAQEISDRRVAHITEWRLFNAIDGYEVISWALAMARVEEEVGQKAGA